MSRAFERHDDEYADEHVLMKNVVELRGVKMGNDNERLFFHGVKANFISFGGFFLAFVGFFLLLIGLSNKLTPTIIAMIIISVIFLVGGIILFFKGMAMRFDYKRRSGTIIHKGDW